MTAQEALNITKSNPYKEDAVLYAIKNIEESIRKSAENGNRSCMVDFRAYPGRCQDFCSRYGEDKRADFYRAYDVETEVREYFTKNGFSFRLVTDLVLGGVRQSPFWEICW